ncbi:UNVERIFIED_CONTAM: ABC transporter permease [Clostridioides difficile]|uniref:ABC transporter permease n=1 Tax=Bacillota TaxID=1239 RepID=UPI0006BBA0E5|nr:ABC transporter permease [Clostridioides difficile]KPI46115.1 ABC transporter [Clostridioides difficile]HBY2627151.1 ABC transporter permease [Clostridioides difficile]HBY3615824.1 ABC transporter permease [Clostridioides difficile]
MKTFKTMLKTELKLSLRGMDMFIFAICMPVIVIILLGIIYGDKPAFADAEYTFLQQSFGAVSTIAICAGGLMGLPLVVSDYRNRKILKRLKVTPVKPITILLVEIAIYCIYSLVSLALIYLVAFLFFDFQIMGNFSQFFISFVLVMLSMFSIGMMVGGIAPNMKIASTVASILYFPMLIFSGATLPYEIMPDALQNFANILPLTQGIKLLKGTALGLPIDNILFPIGLMVAIIVICTTISLKFFKWE